MNLITVIFLTLLIFLAERNFAAAASTTKTTAAGTESTSWNFDNQLTALSKPSVGSYSYQYDHRARRVTRDESLAGGVKTLLTFSGGSSVQEASAAGTVLNELIRGSDWGGGVGGLLYTIRSGARSYNSYNSRGDVVSTSDSSGTATWQASYQALGKRTAEQGTNADRQRGNTKDEDPTGLLNEGFRYRDLETGEFISRDPMGFVDGPNVYAYTMQNPWSGFDPEGLSAWSDFKGYWKGVGNGAGNMVTGVATMAWDAHPVVNAGQYAMGNKTGYQKNYEGGVAMAKAAKSLATSSTARMNALDAGLNHVNSSLNDPEKFGELAFNVVTAVATGAEAGVAIASKVKAGASLATSARATAGVAEAEVAVAGGAKALSNNAPARMPALPAGEASYQLKLFPDEAYSRTGHYGSTPTAAQRASVPPGMEFDHNPTLVKHYYEGDGAGGFPGFNLTQNERLQHARSLSSGSAATPAQQRAQGGAAAQYSKEQKKRNGL